MASYQRASNSSKLGTFENFNGYRFFGDLGQDERGGFGPAPPLAPVSSGINAADILGGIGAILAPIAQAGVGIFAAHQQAKLQEAQLKAQGSRPPPSFALPVFLPPPQKKSPALLIILAVVGLAIAGGMIFMMSKGGEEEGGYAPPPGGYAPPPGGYPAAPPAYAPPPVRRVRKKRRRKGKPKKV